MSNSSSGMEGAPGRCETRVTSAPTFRACTAFRWTCGPRWPASPPSPTRCKDGSCKGADCGVAVAVSGPPPLAGAAPGKSAEQRLFCDLAACGLLKADGDWNEKHPRAGSPPNPGWFASKPKETQSAATPNEGPPSGDGALSHELAFVPPALATGADSLLAENLSAAALDGLVTLATRVSVPTIIFGAIFIPSANRIVDEALVPGRPDLSYRWARDEAEVTFKVLIDNQWRPLTYGRLRGRNLPRSERRNSCPDSRRAPAAVDVGHLNQTYSIAPSRVCAARAAHRPPLRPRTPTSRGSARVRPMSP